MPTTQRSTRTSTWQRGAAASSRGSPRQIGGGLGPLLGFVLLDEGAQERPTLSASSPPRAATTPLPVPLGPPAGYDPALPGLLEVEHEPLPNRPRACAPLHGETQLLPQVNFSREPLPMAPSTTQSPSPHAVPPPLPRSALSPVVAMTARSRLALPHQLL